MNKGKRINKICEFVDFPLVAEIGADHGQISLNLVKTKQIDKIYVTDISEKCLNKAIKTFKENNLEYKAEFLVGDGLLVFDQPKPELQVVIAGMGGKEMIQILDSNKRVDQISHFVLQPQKNVIELRQYLLSKGFKIVKDEMVEDSGKFYNVLKVEKGQDSLSKLELVFGKTNLKEKGKDFLAFIKKEREMFETVATLTESTKPLDYIKLLDEIDEELKKENT